MNKSRKEILLAKLGSPLHFDYISNYILFETKENTLKILDELINDGIIETKDKQYYNIRKK